MSDVEHPALPFCVSIVNLSLNPDCAETFFFLNLDVPEIPSVQIFS